MDIEPQKKLSHSFVDDWIENNPGRFEPLND